MEDEGLKIERHKVDPISSILYLRSSFDPQFFVTGCPHGEVAHEPALNRLL